MKAPVEGPFFCAQWTMRSGSPLEVAPVAGGHVGALGGVATRHVAACVRGDALVVEEDFDGALGCSPLDDLASELVGGAVVVALVFDVVVDADARLLPGGEGVRLWGQWSQRGLTRVLRRANDVIPPSF